MNVTIELHREGVTASVEFDNSMPHSSIPSRKPTVELDYANDEFHPTFYHLMALLMDPEREQRSFTMEVKRRCGLAKMITSWVRIALISPGVKCINVRCSGTRMKNAVYNAIVEEQSWPYHEYGTKLVKEDRTVDVTMGAKLDADDRPEIEWEHNAGQSGADLPRWKQW